MEEKEETRRFYTREAWLLEGARRTGEIVAEAAGQDVPPIFVSVGFPKGARVGRGFRAVGQCWYGSTCEDGTPHVFVCPTRTDPVEVLGILLHEQVHATVGCSEGHRGRFIKVLKAAGLVRPWTATTPGPELRERLEAISAELGPYPHKAIRPTDRKRPGSRLRLWECRCGVKVRVARDDFDATCGLCGKRFERKP